MYLQKLLLFLNSLSLPSSVIVRIPNDNQDSFDPNNHTVSPVAMKASCTNVEDILVALALSKHFLPHQKHSTPGDDSERGEIYIAKIKGGF